jgi:hypothetical protein
MIKALYAPTEKVTYASQINNYLIERGISQEDVINIEVIRDIGYNIGHYIYVRDPQDFSDAKKGTVIAVSVPDRTITIQMQEPFNVSAAFVGMQVETRQAGLATTTTTLKGNE